MRNKFVKDDHVFIPGEGCWFKTKKLAKKNFSKNGNVVGLFYETKEILGKTMYMMLCSNVWD
jgi:hypothetical protein